MINLLILSVFPAPYRVAVFKGLSKEFNITVFFDRNKDGERNADWFEMQDQNFSFRVLDNESDIKVYIDTVKRLREFDLVICYDPWTKRSRKLEMECIRKKIPYILNADGAVEINKSFPKKQIKTFYAKRARMCFAGCHKAEEYFQTYGVDSEHITRHPFTSLYKNEILDVPYSFDQKQAMKKELGIEQRTMFLTVGQFIYRKGIDLLLEAWALCNQEAQLYIIGGGPLQKEYENIINNKNLNNVHITGFKQHDELIKYYLAADVFVMPTREDIWGLVINEAMACGLPIISSDRCTAGCELVTNGVNGYVYKYDDVAELAKLIDTMIDNKNEIRECFSAKSLEIIGEYTYENIIDSHIDCINSIV